MRQVRALAATVGLAVVAGCALGLILGTTVASATTRLRSGTLHSQLASHVPAGAGAAPPDLALTGANVTAAVVGTMALLALAFIVVTLIRRRITTA